MSSFILTASIINVLLLNSNGFSVFPSGGWTIGTRTNSLQMATSTIDGKQKQLNNLKEKYDGRFDIASMIDENDSNDISTYDFFAEADAEEANPPQVGQSVTGAIIEMDDNGALVEIGGKMSGFLPLKEASLTTIKHVKEVLQMGQVITAEVVGRLKGIPVISLRSSQLIAAWDEILKVRAADSSFEATVVEVNKGGAVCECFGLKAFLPGSHLNSQADESMIGSKITVKFLDVIEDEGKLVISQKRFLSESMTQLARGQVVSGTVTGLRYYGAFCELEGGTAGLLHISQISYDRVESVENLFKIGQKLKVMVLDHDKVTGRVALSTKALEANPGDMLRDMSNVFENAEETAKKYHERLDAERTAREEAAKDIVAGLGGAMGLNGGEGGNGNGVDPLGPIAESIESILASIVSDSGNKSA
eukprot:gene12958-17374_t